MGGRLGEFLNIVVKGHTLWVKTTPPTQFINTTYTQITTKWY